jgi:polysaccharide export outer membrane protein
MKSWVWLGCASVLLVTGCSDDRLLGRPDLQIMQGSELPAPGRADLVAAQQREYVIAPYDRIAVDVFGMPELTRTIQIDPNGTLALPLVGTVDAAGKTPPELASAIAGRLRGRYVRDPQVAVNAETVNQNITVEGQVRTPGTYPVTGRTSLMKALAQAQGITEDANTSYVVVFRRVNNQQLAALYDLRAIRQGKFEDPELYANDLVSVGESRARRVFGYIFQTGALLTGPLIAVLN